MNAQSGTQFDSDADLHVETATIMFADVVESVRLIEDDERTNVHRIRTYLNYFTSKVIPAHGGTIIERRGDGLLVRFLGVGDAAACALEMHARSVDEVASPLHMRIGIHFAYVLRDSVGHYGKSMNLCARLAALAQPAQTVLSSEARDQLLAGLDAEIVDMGDCYLKHVIEPVRAFRLQPLQSQGLATVTSQSAVDPADGAGSGSKREWLPVVAVLQFAPSEVRDVSAHRLASLLHHQLVSRLGRSIRVSVISRASTAGINLVRHATQGVVRALSADYLISGSVVLVGEQCEVSYQIVRGRDNVTLMSGQVVGSINEVLSEDSEVIAGISSSIGTAVLAHEVRCAQILPLPNLATYTLLLSALSMLHKFTQRDFLKVESLLVELKERLPRSALPAAWLARWHVFRVVQGWSPNPSADTSAALFLSQQALDADPHCSVALTMRGSVARSLEKDLDAAQRYFRLALDVNPNEPLAWLFKGTVHGLRGEGEYATNATSYAMKLSPLDPMRFYFESLSATAATGSRRFEDAIQLAKRALQGNVTHPSTYRTMAISQGMLGRIDEARETIARLLIVEPTATVAGFLERVSERSALNLEFASALADAGLPLGGAALN